MFAEPQCELGNWAGIKKNNSVKHYPSSVCPSPLHPYLSALLPVPVQLHECLCWEQPTDARQKSSKASFSSKVTTAQDTLNMPPYVLSRNLQLFCLHQVANYCAISERHQHLKWENMHKNNWSFADLVSAFTSEITDSLNRPRQQMLKYLEMSCPLCSIVSSSLLRYRVF